jgi:ABC-type transport system involved in multi-copper enzyme maturation permease subunit
MIEALRVSLLIAGNTVRELVRSKLLHNLLLFAVLLIASSMFVAQLTIGQWDRVILDIGLSAIEISGVLVSVLIGVGLVAGEIERRTVFPTLARPVTRGAFLLGRFLGLCAMLAVSVLLMLGVLTGVLRLAGYGISASAAIAALLILLELALMAAAALLFGSFTRPILASAFSLSLFLIGHLLGDLKSFQQRSHSGLAKALTGAAYRLLPDLELLNVKSLAANELPVPHGLAPAAALYGVAYAAALLLIAVSIFSRRDLK